jgi:hypothetical protein
VQGGTPTGKGDSGAGVEGKKGNTNSWHSPIVKKGNKNKNSPQARAMRTDRTTKNLDQMMRNLQERRATRINQRRRKNRQASLWTSNQ